MNPSVDLRITSLIRAMQNHIVPALMPGIALEEAKLVVSHLRVLQEQVDRAFGFEEEECRSIEKLAVELVSRCVGGLRTTEACTRLAHDLAVECDMTPDGVRDRFRTLSLRISELANVAAQDADPGFLNVCRERILRHGLDASASNRSWFSGMAFEDS
jgi:hypothetical protein